MLVLVQNAEAVLKLSKCLLSDSIMLNLGQTIRLEILAVDGKNCEKVLDPLLRTTQTKMRSFVGLCSVYCCTTSVSLQVTLLLRAKTRENDPFKFKLVIAELDSFAEIRE